MIDESRGSAAAASEGRPDLARLSAFPTGIICRRRFAASHTV